MTCIEETQVTADIFGGLVVVTKNYYGSLLTRHAVQDMHVGIGILEPFLGPLGLCSQ